jgi:tricorn protease
VKEKQKFEKPMALADIEVPVDPRAEWRQLFLDAFRFERDFFYDPGMHGVNWNAMKERYMTLLDEAVTRWDVNWVIGEFLGELNASHTYHGGGDEEQVAERSVGMLGVDWELANGAYKIARIVRGGPWDTGMRSPLDEPGVDVKEGEYVLAVNGVALDPKMDPWARFEGLGKKTVVLTVNAAPSMANARQVVVTVSTARSSCGSALDRERPADRRQGDRRQGRLHLRPEHRHRRAERADAAVHGAVEERRAGHRRAVEQRRPDSRSLHRAAAPADRRLLGGARRAEQQWPPVAHRGAQVMLINGWSGSGGDAFPFYFRQAGLGPLIGTRRGAG